MKKKNKLNLIEELTTHKCDYQVWPITPTEPRVGERPREEPIYKAPPQHIQLDPQSHAPYKPSVHVPFDLYIAPKPIIGKDPREPFKTSKLPKKRVSHENNAVTTILSPCLAVNEIKSEDHLRKVLNYTYARERDMMMKKAALKIPDQVHNITNRIIDEGRSLKFVPTLFHPLPKGWITAARHWDSLQNRGLGDPFKTFWTRRGPEVECGCCCNPVPDMLPKETVEEIDRLICEDRLRIPYDVTKTGYLGYRPICAKGVPLEKKLNQ